MRECIYCGKQLEKGEQCNCALSVARRNAKNTQTPKSKSDIKKENAARNIPAILQTTPSLVSFTEDGLGVIDIVDGCITAVPSFSIRVEKVGLSF